MKRTLAFIALLSAFPAHAAFVPTTYVIGTANGITIDGGASANLSGSTRTLGIAAGGIGNASLANSAVTLTAGSGLSGGGAVSLGGSVALSIASAAVTNTMLQHASVNVIAGTGLTGGGSVALGADISLALAAPTSSTLGGVKASTCSSGGKATGIDTSGNLTCGADANAGGTVTLISTGAGLTGGPISTTGTLSIATGGIAPSMVSAGTYAVDVSGNAATVTNGLYSTASYSDPAWLTSIAAGKVIGAVASATSFTGSLSGDVGGSQGATVVSALQGRSVSSTAPTDGNVLAWSASDGAWKPTAASGGSGAWKAPARVAVGADVPNLSAVDVTTLVPCVTLHQGDRVAIVGQASRDGVEPLDHAHGGLYVVGPVSGTTAALTRAPDAATAADLPPGTTFAVYEDEFENESGATYRLLYPQSATYTLDVDYLDFRQVPSLKEDPEVYWQGQQLFVQVVGLGSDGTTSISATHTLTPTRPVFSISGTSGSYVNTIDPPGFIGQSINGTTASAEITIIPISDGLALQTGGNVGKAVSLVKYQAAMLTYYGGIWYPH